MRAAFAALTGWAALRPRAGRRAELQRQASQSLAPAASIHAVRWHDEELLIGCTAQQMVVLARRPAASAASEVRA